MTLERQAKTHIYVSLLLRVTCAYNFAYRDGWKNAQMPGDDPAYVAAARSHWDTSGNQVRGMTWSPGYIALMSPFIGMFGEETGYKLWRFGLFGTVSLLV